MIQFHEKIMLFWVSYSIGAPSNGTEPFYFLEKAVLFEFDNDIDFTKKKYYLYLT